jgi:hypothetical protein
VAGRIERAVTEHLVVDDQSVLSPPHAVLLFRNTLGSWLGCTSCLTPSMVVQRHEVCILVKRTEKEQKQPQWRENNKARCCNDGDGEWKRTRTNTFVRLTRTIHKPQFRQSRVIRQQVRVVLLILLLSS